MHFGVFLVVQSVVSGGFRILFVYSSLSLVVVIIFSDVLVRFVPLGSLSPPSPSHKQVEMNLGASWVVLGVVAARGPGHPGVSKCGGG